jgi:cytochrome c-type biogenesis protein CcmH
MCTCGCRQSLYNCHMVNCEGHAAMSASLDQFLGEGKDHDQVIAAFIQKFGSQEVLMSPVDEGFNRIAWLLPYAVGIAGLGFISVAAIRWSRQSRLATAGGPDTSIDADLNDRLDDELRNLD